MLLAIVLMLLRRTEWWRDKSCPRKRTIDTMSIKSWICIDMTELPSLWAKPQGWRFKVGGRSQDNWRFPELTVCFWQCTLSSFQKREHMKKETDVLMRCQRNGLRDVLKERLELNQSTKHNLHSVSLYRCCHFLYKSSSTKRTTCTLDAIFTWSLTRRSWQEQ